MRVKINCLNRYAINADGTIQYTSTYLQSAYQQIYRATKIPETPASASYFKVTNLLAKMDYYSSREIHFYARGYYFDAIITRIETGYEIFRKAYNNSKVLNVYYDGSDIYVLMGSWRIMLCIENNYSTPVITEVDEIPSDATAVT